MGIIYDAGLASVVRLNNQNRVIGVFQPLLTTDMDVNCKTAFDMNEL